ncbi:hypothetical protein CKAH01_06234 [Colletotrichum kahawae]|uniref:DUF6594 domain-containing protein n=1 Tax=Colletotrichum kahawae TaxID=34407 RepID=A0AAD9YAV0_COLKA|nr:hypothetical protein CKAH01_06234 [Colletotrichum kahawae]
MQHRSRSARDPFLATGKYAIDDHVLGCNIGNRLDAAQDMKIVRSLMSWQDDWHHDDKHSRYSLCDNLWKRVVCAIIGGAFLVGPMWLMVLNDELYKTLLITTGFVTTFGLVMASILKEGKDVLGSTAAYAAVLVVFVGTNNS